MRKLVAHLILTLDGVAHIDAVIPEIMALRTPEEVEPDFYGRVAEEDAMLLGRVTYQQWSQFWPGSDIEPFSGHINRVPKYVVSNTLATAPWGSQGSATVLRGELTESIGNLKRQPGGVIGVHGSPSLVESLLQADLLDELRLEIYPLLAGSGRRFFAEGRPSKRLTLLRSLVARNGVAILSYRSAGAA